MKKKTKKLLTIVGSVGAAATATYYLLGDIIYKVILTRKGVESPTVMKFTFPDGNEDDYTKYLHSVIDKGVEWFESQDKENIQIPSTKYDKTLHANYLKAHVDTNKTAIVIHGYSASPSYMGVYVKKYLEMGYNVLTPSLNGHADSDEQQITMGWEDRIDIVDWIHYLIDKNPNVEIVIHGVSMGAATTMMTTGEKLPKNVKAAVSDCGYTSVYDMFRYKIVDDMKMTEFPVLNSFNAANKHFSGFDFKDASCIDQLNKSETPTLFIHGAEDDFVPVEMLDKVYYACAAPKEKLLVPKAIHARSVAANPELYWDTVTKFLEKYI